MGRAGIDLIRRTRIVGKSSPNYYLPLSYFFTDFPNISVKDGPFSPKLPGSDNKLKDGLCSLRKMMRKQPLPPVIKFTELLIGFVKKKHYFVALSVFDEMRRIGAPVDEYTMNITINCCCLMEHVEFGFGVMCYFFKIGFGPDAVTISTLINGLFVNDKAVDATILFNKMLDFRFCKPSGPLILTLVDGLCKAGHVDDARALFGRLERSKWSLNIKAYNAMIDGLCKSGMVDDAYRLHLSMIDKGICPDIFTHTSLICGFFGVSSRWNYGKISLITPSFQDVASLINGYCNKTRVDGSFTSFSST